MHTNEFTKDDLDQFNYRSDIRAVARDHLDNEMEDEREVNAVIAHYANLLLNQRYGTDVKVTTTRYNEKVIITTPNTQSPVWEKSFRIPLREEMWRGSWGRREYANQFRDVMRRFIHEAARKACEVASDVQFTAEQEVRV